MKILFLGSPKFGVMVLKKMLDAGLNVIGVVCAPDKPSGRGNKLTFPAVKEFAIEKEIPVYQFDKIRNHVDKLKDINPELMVTASFGQILSQKVLDVCPTLNVHPSMLPEYRGAAPINWAILDGKEKTGVTIMRTDAGIDTGDIISQQEVEILPDEDYSSLEARLADIGGDMIVEAVKNFENLIYIKQPEKFTYARMFTREDEVIDFNNTARDIVNKVRALAEVTGVYFTVGEDKYHVYKAKVAELKGKTGEILDRHKRLVIGCKDGSVEILEIKMAGGKRMDVKSFLNGRKI